MNKKSSDKDLSRTSSGKGTRRGDGDVVEREFRQAKLDKLAKLCKERYGQQIPILPYEFDDAPEPKLLPEVRVARATKALLLVKRARC